MLGGVQLGGWWHTLIQRSLTFVVVAEFVVVGFFREGHTGVMINSGKFRKIQENSGNSGNSGFLLKAI